MDTVPLDVLRLLADEFLTRRDRASLSATCTKMTPLREALFKTLRLTEADYVEPTSPDLHLLDIVRQENAICSYVRNLEVLVEAPHPLRCIEIISSMKFLRKLHIAIPWRHSSVDSLSLENALVRLVTLPTLQSLTLSNDWDIPIVKITNAFASAVRPIDELCFNNCTFTLLEMQAHIIEALPIPKFNLYDRRKRAQAELLLTLYQSAAESLAPIHKGRQWLPASLDLCETPLLGPCMSTFFDARTLRHLTLDWPPQAPFDFGAWGIISLDQLGLRVVGNLERLEKYNVPLCAQLLIFINFSRSPSRDTVFHSIADFLSTADSVQHISIKVVADHRAIHRLVTESGLSICHAICSAHPSTASLLFGLSIAIPYEFTLACISPWRDAQAYSDWFEELHARMQDFLPTHGGHRVRTGLFLEMERTLNWDLTPSLDADLRSTAPWWFSYTT